jgi:hypothetical protein
MLTGFGDALRQTGPLVNQFFRLALTRICVARTIGLTALPKAQGFPRGLRRIFEVTICFCTKHGRQPCEKVSKTLFDAFKNGGNISRIVRDFSFLMEDLEWPFYGLREEVEHLSEVCVDGGFTIQSDERLNEVLGRITVMCFACLKEAMNGAPLPAKEDGP